MISPVDLRKLRGPARLLIVIAAVAAAVWVLWTPYRDAFDQISHQPSTTRASHARTADDMPRRHSRMECAGSIWSDKLQCGPWQYGPAPEEDR